MLCALLFLAAPVATQAGLAFGQESGSATLRRAIATIDRGEFDAGVALLETLVRAGNVEAARRLGELEYFGRGVPEDENRAFHHFSQAAAGGDRDAMFWLGRMCLLGHGPAQQEPDADRDAARWFFEAARRGHADAQYHLGLLFLAGTGVEKSSTEAMRWIRRAAAGGQEGAKSFLATRPATPPRRTANGRSGISTQ